MSNHYHAIISSPLGKLGIVMGGEYLSAIDFLAGTRKEKTPDSPMAKEVVYQLGQYFKNPEWEFSIPLLPADTAFRRRIRNALRSIPVGKVRSYGDVAKKLKTAPRAVGGAVGLIRFRLWCRVIGWFHRLVLGVFLVVPKVKRL